MGYSVFLESERGRAVAKSVSPQDAILAGLKKALESLPNILPLTGTGGIFAAKAADLAKAAVEQGFLESKEMTKGTGKKAKTIAFGLITEKGIDQVLNVDNPKKALEALLPAVQAIGKQAGAPGLESFRSELHKATETCVKAIQAAFGKLESEVLKAVTPSAAPVVDAGMILAALHHAVERVTPSPRPAAPHSEGIVTSPVEEAIVAFVTAWAKEKTVGCQFDVLWNHLKEQNPKLTNGVFQDSLRRLHETNRIRLSGWPRTHDEMPHPELALFVSSKVMYHANPANPNG
jgi:hypothetical protein